MSDDLFGWSSATLSTCRMYRYDLWRKWSNDAPYCMFIGLNPSTADETKDDQTIRKCVGYAKRWNYGGLCMTNLFAFRATQPRDMMRAQEPIGADNNRTLLALSKGAGIVIAAWGKHGSFMARANAVTLLIPHLYCLHRNGDGSPGHPLYLPGDAMPQPLPSNISR